MTGSLASIDSIWQSSGVASWLVLAAGILFALIALVTMLRVERSVANAALAIITVVALTVTGSLMWRGTTNGGERTVEFPRSPPASSAAALPALACVDDLAGDIVLTACERVLFGSADSVAAAVSYAASRINQLPRLIERASRDAAAAVELAALRRSIERDRYGLMAYVLMAREQCQSNSCATFALLSDSRKIAANMDERTYAALVARHAPEWNAPSQPLAPGTVSALQGLPPSLPTGKPTNAEFPNSNSIPPINIMTPEPPLATVRPAPPPAAAKKQTAQPKARPSSAASVPPPQVAPVQGTAPVQLAPRGGRADN